MALLGQFFFSIPPIGARSTRRIAGHGTLGKIVAAVVEENGNPVSAAISGQLRKVSGAATMNLTSTIGIAVTGKLGKIVAAVEARRFNASIAGSLGKVAGDAAIGAAPPVFSAVSAWDIADINLGTSTLPDSIGSNHGTTVNLASGDIGTFPDNPGIASFTTGLDSGQVRIPNTSDFRTNDISMSLVMNTSNNSGDKYLGGIWSDGSHWGPMLLGQHGSAANGGVAFRLNGGASDLFINFAASVRDGHDHHLCFTYETSTGHARAYVDGVLSGSNDQTPGKHMDIGTAPPMGIGAINAGGSWFSGTSVQLGRVRWWNRALSAAEVALDADYTLS